VIGYNQYVFLYVHIPMKKLIIVLFPAMLFFGCQREPLKIGDQVKVPRLKWEQLLYDEYQEDYYSGRYKVYASTWCHIKHMDDRIEEDAVVEIMWIEAWSRNVIVKYLSPYSGGTECPNGSSLKMSMDTLESWR